MARTKYSEQFCAYCNKETKMVLVGTMEGQVGKIWYKCTRCHYTSLLEDSMSSDQINGKLDPSTATVYKPCQCFKIGEAIFHSEWNDVGKVLSKLKTSDGSQAIVVSFAKLGQRKLIENLQEESILELTVTE